MENKKFDLEDRLVKFACICLEVCELLPDTKSGETLGYHLSKSSTGAAFIYDEVHAAESKVDFIHKMKLVLKELRESRINLRVIFEKPLVVNEKVVTALKEANALTSIFLKSVHTAEKNNSVRITESEGSKV